MVCFHGFANRPLALMLPIISSTISNQQRKYVAEVSLFPCILPISTWTCPMNRMYEGPGFLFPWHFGMIEASGLSANKMTPTSHTMILLQSVSMQKVIVGVYFHLFGFFWFLRTTSSKFYLTKISVQVQWTLSPKQLEKLASIWQIFII